MPRYALLAATALACLPLAACDDDPAGPGAGTTLPIVWTFDGGLDGWTAGVPSAAGHEGSVTTAGGAVILRGRGALGEADAWIARTVTLPADAYTLVLQVRGDCGGEMDADDGDTNLRIQILQGTAATVLRDWTEIADAPYSGLSVDFEEYAGQTITIRIEMDDNGGQEPTLASGETLCVDEVRIIGD